MLPDGEGTRDDGEDEERLIPGTIGEVSMTIRSVDGEERQRDGGGDTTDRDILRGVGEGDEDENEDAHSDRHESAERPAGGSDPLPALKIEPWGIIVPHDRAKGCDHLDGISKLSVRHKVVREEDRQEAFQEIEEETENAWAFSENTEDIGGSNITGSVLANIDAFESPQNEAEGNGAEKESEEGKKPEHVGEDELFGSIRALDRLDDDGLDGDISMTTDSLGLHGLDLIDDIHALHDLSEDSVTVAGAMRVIEVIGPGAIVVDDIDEELVCGTIDDGSAGHGDGAALIAAGGRALVLDRFSRHGSLGELAVLHFKSPTLDHEVADDAVEDDAVVGLRINIGQKVRDGNGSLFRIQLDVNVAVIRGHDDGGLGGGDSASVGGSLLLFNGLLLSRRN